MVHFLLPAGSLCNSARRWTASLQRTSVSVPLAGCSRQFIRRYVEKIIKTPFMADSITQGTLASWEKKVGEFVKQDETVANIETDKVTIPVNSPESGRLVQVYAKRGDTIQVGSDLFKIDLDQTAKECSTAKSSNENLSLTKSPPPKGSTPPSNSPSPSSQQTQPMEERRPATEPLHPPPQSAILEQTVDKTSRISPPTRSLVIEDGMMEAQNGFLRPEHREKMTRMRLRIAERMKESQNIAAALTTFNEIDMSTLIEMRNKHKDEFLKKHGVKLGFLSPFVRATAQVLQDMPVVNARMDTERQEIVYHDYVDISIAVATPKGLVTPVLRDCSRMTLAQVEKTIQDLADRARDNKISIEELAGGTFTISNGGVFGSMMGTPIINVPQSAILGMHAIKDRPVVGENGTIVVRPMMYVALTYDHRLIDGREAVTFLVRLKQLLEDPHRFLLDI